MMRRYGWIAILLVLLIVGGAAFNEYRKASARGQAQAAGDAIVAALQSDDPIKRIAALEKVKPEAAPTKMVLDLITASEQIEAVRFDDAVASLNRVSNNNDADLIYRQVAAFKALLLQGKDLKPDARRQGYEALVGPKSPLRLLALEQLALIDVETGDAKAALKKLSDIAGDDEATAGLRRRAAQLIVALGGLPKADPKPEKDQEK